MSSRPRPGDWIAACYNRAQADRETSRPTALPVQFAGTFTRWGGGAPYGILWNFGDGQTGSASIFPFTHQFTVQSVSETFTIVLTVTDDDGASDTAVQNVTVNP